MFNRTWRSFFLVAGETALEKMQDDLYYVKHMSLRFDALIALETVKTVVLRRGARRCEWSRHDRGRREGTGGSEVGL
jgi:hypothetical protein